jgi:hypothetical protein
MTSPMMTVLVLAVLWLIVVVPMIVRRHDERADERSVDQFGRSMRALTRRHVAMSRPAASRPAVDATSPSVRRLPGSQAELFIPGPRPGALAPSRRRPVPAAEETLMHPVDRSDLSPARAQMMARRRRSLAILCLGTVVSLVLALVVGGPMWVPALLFLSGFGGYVYFLRSQVRHDRQRREARQVRAAAREPAGYEVTELSERYADESAVRIDDDDPALHDHDTVDLTGLYEEDGFVGEAAQRRAS